MQLISQMTWMAEGRKKPFSEVVHHLGITINTIVNQRLELYFGWGYFLFG